MREKIFNVKTKRILFIIPAIFILAGIICGVFFSKKDSFVPNEYAKGQQVEFITDENILARNFLRALSSNVRDFTAKAGAAVNPLGGGVTIDNSLSEDELCSPLYAFSHYGTTVYKLGHSRNFGKTKYSKNTFAESLYGLRIETEEQIAYYTLYSHDAKWTIANSVNLLEMNDGTQNTYRIEEAESIDFERAKGINMSNLNDGLYQINANFVNESGDSSTVSGYIYKTDSMVYTCCIDKKTNVKRMGQILEELDKWTKNLTPEKYLSLEKLTYPSSGEKGVVNDVSKIAEFSHTLVDETYNDEAKIYAFTQWLADNIAYDLWKTDVNDNHSRAFSENNYTDPELFMWTNHVGVCWDYTNALAIMCREHGIPATSIETPTHTWDIVYVNGHWESLDLCSVNLYFSKEKEPDIKKWSRNYYISWDDYMAHPDSSIFSVESTNQCMWTYNLAYALGDNPEEKPGK